MSDPDAPASSSGESPASRRAPRTSRGHAARGRVRRSPSAMRHDEHHAKRTRVERVTLRIAKAVGLVRPLRKKPLPKDPVESAKAAHCRYVDDSGPGIRRVKAGKGWKLVSPQGKPIRDREILARVKSLVIPPAWTDVWICPDVDGHIQATGRDARGRKQYRYHWRFREVREETKYERMMEFAEALPAIRAKVDEDLGKPGLTREKVLATVVRLLEITLIRIGNEEYARENGSFGLTTMRTRHVDISGSSIEFHFRGKSGKDHAVKVQDRRLARVVQRCNDLPGEVLFQYVDEEGQRHAVESSDVNEYLRQITGAELTAKDFRTWAGTVLAAQALKELAAFDTKAAAKKNIVEAVKNVSSRLGNTPSVCRKCYVHPQIFDAYLDGHLAATLQQRAEKELRESLPSLSSEEAAVLMLLRDRLAGKRPVPAPAPKLTNGQEEELPPHSRAA
ncbi:MAG: topoisomerase [Myxococcaceae bacterium]|nr:topoisomerase [Myxococcaceae bacterium]